MNKVCFESVEKLHQFVYGQEFSKLDFRMVLGGDRGAGPAKDHWGP